MSITEHAAQARVQASLANTAEDRAATHEAPSFAATGMQ
jgi:hypothetical protein